MRRFAPGRASRSSRSETRRVQRFLSSGEQGERYRNGEELREVLNEDDQMTNLYHCIKFGLNWWRHVQRTQRIPSRINRELADELSRVDIRSLEEKFGKRPKRSQLADIEHALGIDLYLLYGGRFSPLGVSYRPESHSVSMSVRDVMSDYESKMSTSRSRPMIVLQSARPYFHTLGHFYVIPTRKVAEDRDREWINLWRAIVKYKWPKLLDEASQNEKIIQIKNRLRMAADEKFSIADGVFTRLATLYGVSVRLYIGKIVNDNVNLKECFYGKADLRGKGHLHLLVASYKEDEFAREFKAYANVSYDELRRNPGLNPSLAADAQYQRERRRELADRGARAAGLFDLPLEGETDIVDDVEQVADDDDDDDVYREFMDNQASSSDDDDAASFDSDWEFHEIERDNAKYRPIRNLAGLAPNVFDDDTLVRILKQSELREMPICPTKNCLYSHHKPSYMRSHIKHCTDETTCRIRQSVQGPDVIDFIGELFEEGYLPSPEFSQEYFVSYDIECLMSRSALGRDDDDDDERQYHNLVTLAAMTSDGEQECFYRKDMSPQAVMVMLFEFVKFLTIKKNEMIDRLPQEVKDGVKFYSEELSDPDRRKKYSFDQLIPIRKKLYYLRDFYKLKVYSWNGEHYDLCVLYPMLSSVLYEVTGQRSNQVKPIKRDGGYMLLDGAGLSFRDFRNYSGPMTLESLARSCGLDAERFSKGSFNYEWYTSIEQLENAFHFSAYTTFYSTLFSGAASRGEKYSKEMNDMILEIWGECSDRTLFKQNLITFLQLQSLEDDPVVKELEASPLEYSQQKINLVMSLFSYSEERKCFQCDPRNEATRDFFRFSPRKYEESFALWCGLKVGIERQGKRMNMLIFLINYNFNDVRLLTASINAYAGNYKEKFSVGLHGDLSIAKMAQKIAFMMYDKSLPPIYSVPPKAAFFYKDMRAKLSGGICQVLHRAINVNAEDNDPRLPRAATHAPNGERFRVCELWDLNAMYSWAVRRDVPCGPGILYTLDSVLPRATTRFQSDVVAGSDYAEGEKRFFGAGLFNQRQNTSDESIRWLEYLNWKKDQGYGGKIQHSYNLVEKEIVKGVYVDGYHVADDGTKTIFEFRGCSYHYCPFCRVKPFYGLQKKVKGADGKLKKIKLTIDELIAADDARIHKIVDELRRPEEKVMNGHRQPDGTILPMFGPLPFSHKIKIKYACRWLKQWAYAELTNDPPYSPSYPMLYKGARPEFTGCLPGQIGVTEDDFRALLRRKINGGKSAFFGLAMVDLRSPDWVVEKYPHVPPIFDKIKLESDMLHGYMKNYLTDEQKAQLYPNEENIFCYHTKRYLVTSDMLEYLDAKGLVFKLHYFVEYFRGAPFNHFVTKLVADRVAALEQGNITMQLVIKLLLNSMVGRFALAVARFLTCMVVGSDKMLNCIRSPMLKSMKQLRVEDKALEPLHEVLMKKKNVEENLALQIQIFVYQVSVGEKASARAAGRRP